MTVPNSNWVSIHLATRAGDAQQKIFVCGLSEMHILSGEVLMISFFIILPAATGSKSWDMALATLVLD